MVRSPDRPLCRCIVISNQRSSANRDAVVRNGHWLGNWFILVLLHWQIDIVTYLYRTKIAAWRLGQIQRYHCSLRSFQFLNLITDSRPPIYTPPDHLALLLIWERTEKEDLKRYCMYIFISKISGTSLGFIYYWCLHDLQTGWIEMGFVR